MASRKPKKDPTCPDRAARIEDWSEVRNLGIREGLEMALAAIPNSRSNVLARAAIITRGTRHFGSPDWRK